MIKVLEISGILATYVNITKAKCSKPAANIKIKWRETQSNSTKIRNKIRSPLSPYLFNIVLEVLAIATRQQNKIKGIQIGKEEVKLCYLQMV